MAERLEDLNLPNASVQKIIKDALPDSINVGKDARTALGRAASVFVLYITSHASQEAQRVNRKTLVGQDVIAALENLEFENLIGPLMKCLSNYKTLQKTKRDKNRQKKANDEDEEDVEGEEHDAEDGEK